MDNGLGFDQQADLGPDHYGLSNMKERAKEIPAIFTIQSAFRKGTTILLEVDLNHSAPDFGLGKFLSF